MPEDPPQTSGKPSSNSPQKSSKSPEPHHGGPGDSDGREIDVDDALIEDRYPKDTIRGGPPCRGSGREEQNAKKASLAVTLRLGRPSKQSAIFQKTAQKLSDSDEFIVGDRFTKVDGAKSRGLASFRRRI